MAHVVHSLNVRRSSRFQAGSLLASLLFAMAAFAPRAFAASGWVDPTPEELSMTAQPQVPGAAAVYLYREETTDDLLHMHSVYVRLKVLTEQGKEYANVELDYNKSAISITDISGRTIHSDGTIVPFAGKPYDKLIVKTQVYQHQAKVFTMPDVQIGSILEYRYKLRYDDYIASSPDWYIQTELYMRKGHYQFIPTDKTLVTNHGNLSQTVAWMPILPKGAEVKSAETPGANNHITTTISLDVQDIPPAPDEEYMPPVHSFSYRVFFYYSAYRTGPEFWKNEGNYWSKSLDKFANSGGAIGEAVHGMVQPGDTDDQKLRKIYAAVQTIDNTDFTREHSVAEDKSEGLGATKNAGDIWSRKRGSSDQIAMVFIAMGRAAGLKAYGMAVTNRDNSLFNPSLLRWSQLDDVVAIVAVDGKEQFFDPGERDCPYGQMHWKHTVAQGVRQVDGGTAVVGTPSMIYTQSQVQRVADLKMDPTGTVAGLVKMTWLGAPALHWRQTVLKGDTTSVQQAMEKAVTALLPGGMELKVASMVNLDDYEKPLVVTFDATGPVAVSTGKRLLVPGQLFQSNEKPKFSQDKREQPVYFSYPSETLDAVRIKLPPNMTVESAPQEDLLKLNDLAFLHVSSQVAPGSFLVRRSLAVNSVLFFPKEYSDLRGFYTKVADKDQEPVILKLDNTGAAVDGAVKGPTQKQAETNAKAN